MIAAAGFGKESAALARFAITHRVVQLFNFAAGAVGSSPTRIVVYQ
jgi:hypothetical protein